ncbi:MAG: hypothetical protein AAFZ06_09245 [Pseudomonadota bacterium]
MRDPVDPGVVHLRQVVGVWAWQPVQGVRRETLGFQPPQELNDEVLIETEAAQ